VRVFVSCVLFAATALLAWSETTFGTPSGLTQAGRVAGGLGYAFGPPILIALPIAAWLNKNRGQPGQPSNYRYYLNWTWGVVIAAVWIAHLTTVWAPAR
jgi:hypothetical protein